METLQKALAINFIRAPNKQLYSETYMKQTLYEVETLCEHQLTSQKFSFHINCKINLHSFCSFQFIGPFLRIWH